VQSFTFKIKKTQHKPNKQKYLRAKHLSPSKKKKIRVAWRLEFFFEKNSISKNEEKTRGKGTPQYYSYFDAYFSENTINYYRLKQIDNDNKTAYSKTIALATQGEKTLKVSPTIVENGVLNVIFDVYTEGSSFSIVNLMGQQIMSGKTANSIDVSDLPQGVFILKMGALQAKFIKQ
jgi:hypothetical protein